MKMWILILKKYFTSTRNIAAENLIYSEITCIHNVIHLQIMKLNKLFGVLVIKY